ncbi:hypothetical protein CBL_20920, partial [Carabus blaptoides fortunei]
MKLKFEFNAVASPKDSRTTVIAITSIVTEQGEKYAIPEELIYADFHEELRRRCFQKEINKHIDADTMIDRIAFGLPEFIREKIDRDEMENSKDVINELQELERKTDKKKILKKEGKPEHKVRNEDKKPCKTCEG